MDSNDFNGAAHPFFHPRIKSDTALGDHELHTKNWLFHRHAQLFFHPGNGLILPFTASCKQGASLASFPGRWCIPLASLFTSRFSLVVIQSRHWSY